jgi:hypothetical protein
MFYRAAMTMYEDPKGAWKVDPVQITRLGNLQFWMSNQPPVGTGLPLGRPFRCDPEKSVSDGNGNMVTQLVFDPDAIAEWHDSPDDPFDRRRTVQLTMKVCEVPGVEHEETLYVRLSCREHFGPRAFFPAIAQVVVTVVASLVYFFKQLFTVKRGRLDVEDGTELAAEGVRGGGKELRR